MSGYSHRMHGNLLGVTLAKWMIVSAFQFWTSSSTALLFYFAFTAEFLINNYSDIQVSVVLAWNIDSVFNISHKNVISTIAGEHLKEKNK